jgi:hypothetical protein
MNRLSSWLVRTGLLLLIAGVILLSLSLLSDAAKLSSIGLYAVIGGVTLLFVGRATGIIQSLESFPAPVRVLAVVACLLFAVSEIRSLMNDYASYRGLIIGKGSEVTWFCRRCRIRDYIIVRDRTGKQLKRYVSSIEGIRLSIGDSVRKDLGMFEGAHGIAVPQPQ